MVYDIKWTRIAYISLDTNIEFIKSNWSKEITNEFLILVDNTISIIKQNPKAFQISSTFPNYRKAIIHDNVSMFYKLDDTSSIIYISLIWPNRMDPKFLKELL